LGRSENRTGFWWGNLKERDHLEDLSIYISLTFHESDVPRPPQKAKIHKLIAPLHPKKQHFSIILVFIFFAETL
jgi:hypothetical protein